MIPNQGDNFLKELIDQSSSNYSKKINSINDPTYI